MKTYHRYASCVVLIVLLASLSVSGASAQNGPVVLPGYDSAAVARAAVVFRNFGGSSSDTGHEVFLGGPVGSGGEPSPGSKFELPGTWPAPSHVTFSYDGAGTIRASAPDIEGEYAIGNLGTINYIRISVVVLAPNTMVNLASVTLGSAPLGSFSGEPDKYRNWHVKGVDLSAGFSLKGDIQLSGLQPTGGTNRVVIEVGYLGVDTERPISSNVTVDPSPAHLGCSVTLTARVDDSTTGGSAIQSAQYSLNGAGWAAMSASDGDFGSVIEQVTAGFTANQLGRNEVCVRGTDAKGNVGNPTCAQFVVSHAFDGFYEPITVGVTNVANAGRAIPVKWRLTNCGGAPVTDAASFVGLYSPKVRCDSLSGDPTDAVGEAEEVAAGSSGLQYNGDGHWQYNWKTPKSYAGTCRLMYVQLAGGITSPTVSFSFR